MSRKFSLFALVAAMLIFSGQLFAGGPPWLCVPINGVTKDNAGKCAQLLTTKLERKLRTQSGRDGAVKIRQHNDHSYATFYLGDDVSLHDIEAALAGSSFSVPREQLHLFGHVVLEIDPQRAPRQELLSALDALEFVSITESAERQNLFHVTIDMPYPAGDRADRESVGWEKFQRNDFNSERTGKSESQATAQTLPSYVALRDLVAKNHASLKDVRWSPNYACRTVGCVVGSDSNTVASAQRASATAAKD